MRGPTPEDFSCTVACESGDPECLRFPASTALNRLATAVTTTRRSDALEVDPSGFLADLPSGHTCTARDPIRTFFGEEFADGPADECRVDLGLPNPVPVQTANGPDYFQYFYVRYPNTAPGVADRHGTRAEGWIEFTGAPSEQPLVSVWLENGMPADTVLMSDLLARIEFTDTEAMFIGDRFFCAVADVDIGQ